MDHKDIFRLFGIIVGTFTVLGVYIGLGAFAYAEFDSIPQEYLKPVFAIAAMVLFPWTITATIAACYFGYCAHRANSRARSVYISDDDVTITNSKISITENDPEAGKDTLNVASVSDTVYPNMNPSETDDVKIFVINEISNCKDKMSVVTHDLLGEHGEGYVDAMPDHLEFVTSERERIKASYEEKRDSLFKDGDEVSQTNKRIFVSSKQNVLDCLEELAQMLAKKRRSEETARKQIEAAGQRAWSCVKMLDAQLYNLTGRPVDSNPPVPNTPTQG